MVYWDWSLSVVSKRLTILSITRFTFSALGRIMLRVCVLLPFHTGRTVWFSPISCAASGFLCPCHGKNGASTWTQGGQATAWGECRNDNKTLPKQESRSMISKDNRGEDDCKNHVKRQKVSQNKNSKSDWSNRPVEIGWLTIGTQEREAKKRLEWPNALEKMCLPTFWGGGERLAAIYSWWRWPKEFTLLWLVILFSEVHRSWLRDSTV